MFFERARDMKYAEALERPEVYDRSLFMAGGITNCPDWQQAMRELLKDSGYMLLNPRRADFPIGEPGAAQEQIEWEYNMLRRAEYIMFWFPKETICPIVLYELGAWSMTGKHIFVGVHPDYQRRQDVEIQTKLVRPNIEIVYSLEELSDQIWSLLTVTGRVFERWHTAE